MANRGAGAFVLGRGWRRIDLALAIKVKRKSQMIFSGHTRCVNGAL